MHVVGSEHVTAGEAPQGSETALYVLVPCFNEEAAVTSTVEDVLRHARTLPLPVKLLLIDDGSTDRTRSLMEELCRENPECSLLVNPRNLGVGRSILRAYEAIPPGSWVTAVPGDNEIEFRSIHGFVARRDEYDVILGYLQNPVVRTIPRRLASFTFSKVVNSLYGFQWRYLNGLKLYRIEAFRDLEVLSGGHAFVAEMLAKAQLRQPHLRVGEAPFVARGRARGSSKAFRPLSVLRAVREVFRGMRSVARYRSAVIRGAEARRVAEAGPDRAPTQAHPEAGAPDRRHRASTDGDSGS